MGRWKVRKGLFGWYHKSPKQVFTNYKRLQFKYIMHKFSLSIYWIIITTF